MRVRDLGAAPRIGLQIQGLLNDGINKLRTFGWPIAVRTSRALYKSHLVQGAAHGVWAL